MDIRTAARLFLEVRTLRRHDRWTRAQLLAHQEQNVARVRAQAFAASGFYQRFHGSAERAFGNLPVLTKPVVMEHWDDIVTDPRVTRDAVRRHMELGDGNSAIRALVILLTSGSTAEPGLFVIDRPGWVSVLASVARSREWAGGRLRLTRRTRTASVSAVHPWSISHELAQNLRSWWVPLLALDARQPRDEIVRLLNDFGPEMLVVYASMGRRLAEEQAQGRLSIHPRLTFTTAEVLSDETRRLMARAFGSEPFNRYSTSETGDLAAECVEGRRLHLFEDAALVEVVDEHDRVVPSGEWGASILVTPFHNRIQPLIRYRLSDEIRVSDAACPCGRPFRVVEEIRGRAEEHLRLPALDGQGIVEVHMFAMAFPIQQLPITAYTVVQEGDGLVIRLERHDGELDEVAFIARIDAALRERGAQASRIVVEHVTEIERRPGAKTPRLELADRADP